MRFLDPKAIKDWIKSRAVNSMMTTEKGFFMDARQGPVIREELDDIQTGLDEINSKLTQMIIVRNYNVKVSIKANSVGFGKIEYSIPDGYQVVGITLMDGGQSVLCQMTSISAGTFKSRNFNSSDIDVTIYATVILLKM